MHLAAVEVLEGRLTVAALEAAFGGISSGGGRPEIVFAGDDETTPRPDVDAPLLWLCSKRPLNVAPFIVRTASLRLPARSIRGSSPGWW